MSRREKRIAPQESGRRTEHTRSVERFHPVPEAGLTPEQVKLRVQQGFHNGNTGIKTKTEGQIIRENLITFFNILNFLLAMAVILVGSYRDALFMGIIVSNAVIGSRASVPNVPSTSSP